MTLFVDDQARFICTLEALAARDLNQSFAHNWMQKAQVFLSHRREAPSPNPGIDSSGQPSHPFRVRDDLTIISEAKLLCRDRVARFKYEHYKAPCYAVRASWLCLGFPLIPIPALVTASTRIQAPTALAALSLGGIFPRVESA
jgi:hypothetical protein